MISCFSFVVCGQQDYIASETTKLVLLGTGNPNPNPERSGCALAIIVNDTPYIIDFGPGVIRQAARLTPHYGGNIAGLSAQNIKTAFLTHLHSDHTTGYPDLILTPWVMGRDAPLEVYGPEGIAEMSDHILKAYQQDIEYRLSGSEPANDQGWRVNSHEIKPGKIYQDENIEVQAFLVEHGTWPNAFGFKFTTPDRTIVISGDTKPCEKLIEMSTGADILVHEVYSVKGFEEKDPVWKTYHAAHHTSTHELGRIASQAKPGLVVMYHVLSWGATDKELLEEIKTIYDGKTVVGNDLNIF
ncbi:MAG: MBL fold metallo-hydrolase [Bacteroidales bacterium]|nr:MBL fold metallo-hydrolase [Bacteroidales bacterium]